MTTITSPHYLTATFDMPDGRQIAVLISKDGEYRLMERTKEGPWSPSVAGTVVK